MTSSSDKAVPQSPRDGERSFSWSFQNEIVQTCDNMFVRTASRCELFRRRSTKKTHKGSCTKQSIRVHPSISTPDACCNASIAEVFGCRLALRGSKPSPRRCYLTEKHFRHTFVSITCAHRSHFGREITQQRANVLKTIDLNSTRHRIGDRAPKVAGKQNRKSGG